MFYNIKQKIKQIQILPHSHTGKSKEIITNNMGVGDWKGYIYWYNPCCSKIYVCMCSLHTCTCLCVYHYMLLYSIDEWQNVFCCVCPVLSLYISSLCVLYIIVNIIYWPKLFLISTMCTWQWCSHTHTYKHAQTTVQQAVPDFYLNDNTKQLQHVFMACIHETTHIRHRKSLLAERSVAVKNTNCLLKIAKFSVSWRWLVNGKGKFYKSHFMFFHSHKTFYAMYPTNNIEWKGSALFRKLTA